MTSWWTQSEDAGVCDHSLLVMWYSVGDTYVPTCGRRLLPPSSGYKKSVVFKALHPISVLPSANIFLCLKNSTTWNRVLRVSVLSTAYEANAKFRNINPSGTYFKHCAFKVENYILKRLINNIAQKLMFIGPCIIVIAEE